MSRWTALLALTPLLVAGSAAADEGMWTFDDFPKARVEQAYGSAPDDAWLERVRLSSARLAFGCSASFVSPRGLVLTNHHCAHGCIQQLSSKREDLVSRLQADLEYLNNWSIWRDILIMLSTVRVIVHRNAY